MQQGSVPTTRTTSSTSPFGYHIPVGGPFKYHHEVAFKGAWNLELDSARLRFANDLHDNGSKLDKPWLAGEPSA